MSGVVLAIDFGSSNTAAAYRDEYGRIHEVRLAAAGSLMPSCVFYTAEQTLVGSTAVHSRLTAPECFEPSPKRRLADREVLLGNHIVPVTDLVAAVLTEALARARRVSGSEPEQVILTHPDKWGPAMRDLLRHSACTAGIADANLRMVSEATAAAWFYTVKAPDLPVGARLAVFDFGAGTCDVAVLDKQPDGTFAVMAADGVEGLGGQDLDARIYSWVRNQLAVDAPALLRELDDPAAVATRMTLHDRIRDAKEALSEAMSAAIVVSAAAGNRLLQLTRDEFDELIVADIDCAVALTKDVLAHADSVRPVDTPPTIYLTGGSSAIPLVHTRLAALGPLGILGDPKTVVAQGALLTPVHAFSRQEPPCALPAPPPPPRAPESAAQTLASPAYPGAGGPAVPPSSSRRGLAVTGTVIAATVVTAGVVAMLAGGSGDSGSTSSSASTRATTSTYTPSAAYSPPVYTPTAAPGEGYASASQFPVGSCLYVIAGADNPDGMQDVELYSATCGSVPSDYRVQAHGYTDADCTYADNVVTVRNGVVLCLEFD